jgi:hypothetical protein
LIAEVQRLINAENVFGAHDSIVRTSLAALAKAQWAEMRKKWDLIGMVYEGFDTALHHLGIIKKKKVCET